MVLTTIASQIYLTRLAPSYKQYNEKHVNWLVVVLSTYYSLYPANGIS